MSIDQLQDQNPDFAKDVRLNLASMADETLSPQSKYGLLLAVAIATRNPIVTAAMQTAAGVVMRRRRSRRRNPQHPSWR